MLEVLILLVGLLIGAAVSNWIYDKKLAKLYKDHVTLLARTHDEAFNQGWRGGEEHGRRQEALERIMKQKPENQ